MIWIIQTLAYKLLQVAVFYPGENVSGKESGLYICPRKPFQPIYHCLVGELTPEYLKGLILGTPQVGKGARNPLLGLYGIKERVQQRPGREYIRERTYPGENQDYIYGHESHSNLLTIASWGS